MLLNIRLSSQRCFDHAQDSLFIMIIIIEFV